MRQKPKPVWVARGPANQSDCLVYATRPRRDPNFPGHWDVYDYGFPYLAAFCPTGFLDVTGFEVKPGECVRVTISVKRVQPKRRKAKK